MLQELSKLFTQGVSGWIAGILLILYLLYAAGCTVKLWGWDLRKHRLPNRIVFPFVFATHTALPVVAALSGQWGTILRVWGEWSCTLGLLRPDENALLRGAGPRGRETCSRAGRTHRLLLVG